MAESPVESAASVLEAYPWDELEQVVVLSPHLDDAALSCGGLVAELRGVAPRLVVTLCAGDPPPGPASESKRSQFFAHPRERRREDREAMQSLACDYLHLGFCDAVYRYDDRGRPLYREFLTGEIHPGDRAHAAAVADAIARICAQTGAILVVAPLAIGRHIDHVICARAAVALAGSGARLLFYQDIPYSVPGNRITKVADTAEHALARLGLAPERELLVPFDLDAKTRLVARYGTQLSMLFRDRDELRQTLGARVHGEHAVETYWAVQG